MGIDGILTCPKCKNTWQLERNIEDESNWCPQCGNSWIEDYQEMFNDHQIMCPNCETQNLHESLSGGYVCYNCGEMWDVNPHENLVQIGRVEG